MCKLSSSSISTELTFGWGFVTQITTRLSRKLKAVQTAKAYLLPLRAVDPEKVELQKINMRAVYSEPRIPFFLDSIQHFRYQPPCFASLNI